jgi:iron complex transport system ATP-binding protein
MRTESKGGTLTAVTTERLQVSYGPTTIVPDLSISLKESAITAIIGPNGSGKSTVLRTIARLQKPSAGAIYLHGREIATMATKEIARRLAILPQTPEIPAGLTVWDLIGYGRYPYQGLIGSFDKEDHAAMEWALEVTNLGDFKHRSVDTLSGGERQRAWIAMALAQQTGTLLLDEPTTFLDIRYQIEVLNLVRTLNREQGITVGWVLHDLNQAAAFSDHIIMLHSGEVYREGDPNTVMTSESIRDVFGIEVNVIPDPINGCPTCLLYGECRLVSS